MNPVEKSEGPPSEQASPTKCGKNIVVDPRYARPSVVPVKPDPIIAAINRYRAAMAELDKIAVREPTLPNGHPADETEEYAVWETASHKAQDLAAAAWADITATQPTTVAGAIALINCYLEVWSEYPIRAEHHASGALKILRSFLRSIAG
jgi:hypothetical protein